MDGRRARRRCRRGSWLALVLLLSVPSPAAWGKPAPAQRSQYAARLELATEHFAAQRYELSRELFDALLADVPAAPERSTIAFNAAVCSFALHDYADARRRFEAIARDGSDLAGLARVNAGFSALHMGELDAAEALSQPSVSDGPDVERRRRALVDQLRAARRVRRERLLQADLDAGFDAVNRKDWELARARLGRVISSGGSEEPSDLAAAHYGLGLVELALGEPRRARRHLAQSLAYQPGDARALLALGHAAEDAHEREAAATAYASALDHPLSDEEIEAAERALDRLYALPPSGPSAYAALGVGYDDNATQSGSREAIGALGELVADSRDGASSPFVSALVALDWTQRTTRQSAGSVHYAGGWLALTDSRLAQFGLQSHELLARWQWSPAMSIRLRFEAGASHVLTGSTSFEPFEWAAVVTARAEVDTGRSSRARLQIGERAATVPDFDYLDGHRLDATASELWRLGAWELSALGSLRYFAAGVQQIELSFDSFPACDPECEGRRYRNSVSYWAPGLGLSAAWRASAALRVSALGRAEQRRYLGASGIAGVPASSKERRDARWRAQLGAELDLDDEERFHLRLEQTLLISVSNVAFDSSQPGHQYDLGDRNFVQNTTELGVSASF